MVRTQSSITRPLPLRGRSLEIVVGGPTPCPTALPNLRYCLLNVGMGGLRAQNTSVHGRGAGGVGGMEFVDNHHVGAAAMEE
jgi:hypothetical protein